ncbi:TolC family protein [Kangiella koreensis]|uniref:Outer membrane efflux protein n=1 Tax=Kangiella koreensis (strain DSM 16069 / JCM 12317 / KCTC 12182 / SW-125) TaxID=523791 RepID=C7RBS4_KANKD|nr:TolC family protein [Kangiella koreensis]ACV26716.1 outer membrane efflux protein [Kangiella koreensis DSM 16069]
MKILTTILIALLGIGVERAVAEFVPESLTLEDTVRIAIETDPWLRSSKYTEEALNNEAIASSSLPDPRMSLMAGNFPVDSFDTNQEAMTQLSVGISQMFPRGDSLVLAKKQKKQLAMQHPFLRLDRRAKVTAMVTQLWLEVFKAQESIRLIELDRALFEQLADAAESSYSSALGRAHQQDIIRAQLELTQLSDRLTVLKQQQESAQKRLSEWIGVYATVRLSSSLPSNSISKSLVVPTNAQDSENMQYKLISHHPALKALGQRINATQTSIELAKQKYKPEWGVTAQYGYRASDPLGRDRADLFSIGVSFDLPIFTDNRQDQEVSAAVNRTEAIKAEKYMLGRRLMAELETASAELKHLDERHALYTEQLLPQMAEQAEASLSSYKNDDGDFAEAVRARIAELNAKIDALTIAVERQKTIAQINYLLTQESDDARSVISF